MASHEYDLNIVDVMEQLLNNKHRMALYAKCNATSEGVKTTPTTVAPNIVL